MLQVCILVSSYVSPHKAACTGLYHWIRFNRKSSKSPVAEVFPIILSYLDKDKLSNLQNLIKFPGVHENLKLHRKES